jgi:hypothetical protein
MDVSTETNPMTPLGISLTADGHFRLHLPSHSVVIPCSADGAAILASTIRDWTEEARIAEKGAPTQHQINEALRGAQWGQVLQLAGARKRRAEIKAATGVTVRTPKRRPEKKPTHEELSAMLTELGL